MRTIAIAVLSLLACSPAAPPPKVITPTAPVAAPQTEKSRTIDALHAYQPGVEKEVAPLVRAIVEKKLFVGDDDVGRALVEALRAVKFANRASGELGATIGDALAVVRAPGTRAPLLEIVKKENSGADTIENKELAGQQAVSAQALGSVCDASCVAPLIDAMFEHASKLATRKDPSSGDEIEQASPFTTAVSMLLGGALAKLGDAAVDPLMPYVRNDENDPKVTAVRKKFTKYISPGGSGKPTAYVDIATTTVASIGTPRVAAAIEPLVSDPKVPMSERRSLIGLLVSLPMSESAMNALKKAYDAADPKLKEDIAASASRTMRHELTDWLIGIGTETALASALWLAPKVKMAALETAFGKSKLLDKRDPLWRVMEATDTACDPKKPVKSPDVCEEHPDKPTTKVIWKDLTPTYKEELAIVRAVVDKCDEKGACYLDAFREAVKLVDKQGFTKVTGEGTRAGITTQKAIWMLAMHGSEDDMISLVGDIPEIQSPAPRSFVQMALSARFAKGSARVADAIDAMVRKQREKGSETANREAAQLEPIAAKLRTRLGKP